MAYGDFKRLPRKTASDKVLRDEALNIAKNPKYDGCEKGLASMVNNFFDRKSSGRTILKVKLCQTKNSLKNSQTKLLQNLRNNKHIHLFKTLFWVLILRIWNLINIKFNKGFRFSTLIVNMRGLFF